MKNFYAFLISMVITFLCVVGAMISEQLALPCAQSNFEAVGVFLVLVSVVAFFYGLTQQHSDNETRRRISLAKHDLDFDIEEPEDI